MTINEIKKQYKKDSDFKKAVLNITTTLFKNPEIINTINQFYRFNEINKLTIETLKYRWKDEHVSRAISITNLRSFICIILEIEKTDDVKEKIYDILNDESKGTFKVSYREFCTTTFVFYLKE